MPLKTGPEFMQKTKYQNLQPSKQQLGEPQPPLEIPIPADAARIDLPRPETLEFPGADLQTVIERRRSIRKYSDESLTLEELSFLLWCTQGVKQVINRPATLRTVPSAGARHAFETYLLINRVDGLKSGLYRFAAIDHQLIPLNLSPDIAEGVTAACLNQRFILTSAVTFIWVAIVERMAWRYTERGYRYLHLDAGHVCQNLYLSSEAIGGGVCAIAAFDDDRLNQTIGVDGESQFAIYLAPMGKKYVG
jgi:SagB-type dehydrogenase family enzyme